MIGLGPAVMEESTAALSRTAHSLPDPALVTAIRNHGDNGPSTRMPVRPVDTIRSS